MKGASLKKRHIHSTQCSVTPHVGKEPKKRVHICICVTDTLCHTPATNIVNQLYSKKNFFKIHMVCLYLHEMSRVSKSIYKERR